MVLALLGAAEGPVPAENQAGAVSRAGPRGSAGISQSCVREEESKSSLQLLSLQIQALECYSLLLFTSLGSRRTQCRALAEPQLPQQTCAF